MQHQQVIIIGSGLAGLAAAAQLAKSGFTVTVLEKSKHLGGRARTNNQGGFRFNRGAHALYKGGAGVRVLQAVGVHIRGGLPTYNHALGLYNDVLHILPHNAATMLKTDLLSLRGKLSMARLMTGLMRIDTGSLLSVSWQDWLLANIRTPDARRLVQVLGNLWTYAKDSEQSAEVVLTQGQLAMRDNVYYLDDGWQSLVDQLTDNIKASGNTIQTGVVVNNITPSSGGYDVAVGGGERLSAPYVIIATDPHSAATLTASNALHAYAAMTRPVKAACLNIGLSSVPVPQRRFVLGIDRPLYYSLHSATAPGMAPPGGGLIHCLYYLHPEERVDASEMESLLDLTQPGWRNYCEAYQFLPEMHVSNALVTSQNGGLAGRPDVNVPGLPGVFVAGDWVGDEGILADASLASAERAVQSIMKAVKAPLTYELS